MLDEAYQHTIRREFLEGKRPLPIELFELPEDIELRELGYPLERSVLKAIPYSTASPFIKEYEWLGCVAALYTIGYGLYWGSRLGAVCIFSLPSAWQMTLICGEEHKGKVLQLTRGAVAYWTSKNTSSHIISLCLKRIEKTTPYRVVMAYADPRAGEIGTVYQATNWLYTGLASGGNDWAPDFADYKSIRFHTRSLPKWLKSKERIQEHGWTAVKVPRPKKHRYVYFLGTRKERKELLRCLKFPALPYPKRESAEVVMEEALPEIIVMPNGEQIQEPVVQYELVGAQYKLPF